MWPVGQLRCRVCSCFFLSVFSSVISVRSLSVCLSVFYMLAALVANKRIHNWNQGSIRTVINLSIEINSKGPPNGL